MRAGERFIQRQDQQLRQRLLALSAQDQDFWTFRDDQREHVHAYFQYPAMMVPQMQAALINAIRQEDPTVDSVFDPFVGSGTILGEAMRLGLTFGGCDINPMTSLICQAKTGPFCVDVIQRRTEMVLSRIRLDDRTEISVDFHNRDKWFRKDVAVALSKIHRAIKEEECLNTRRFLWVMLAETVRLSSNSQTGTVKLHTYPAEKIEERCLHPVEEFSKIVRRNIANMNIQRIALEQQGLLDEGHHYRRPIHLHHGDVRELAPQRVGGILYDLLVTSPPYGDNVTTVTYGQHSYLPLQWIPFADIDPRLDDTWLVSTHEIDSRSLGGKRKNAHTRAADLSARSSAFRALYSDLTADKTNKKDRAGASRLAAFCYDYDQSLTPMLSVLRPNAYMVMTVGNRSICGRTMPLDRITIELLENRGAHLVHRFERAITNKRQAARNQLADTMSEETVLILRKGAI